MAVLIIIIATALLLIIIQAVRATGEGTYHRNDNHTHNDHSNYGLDQFMDDTAQQQQQQFMLDQQRFMDEQEFVNEQMQEGFKSVTPFEDGGYDTSQDSFNNFNNFNNGM